MRLKTPAGTQPEQERKPREEISDFSAASRNRLRLFLATIARACLPFMLTLTYPGEYTTDERQWKADLATWCKRLRRQYPHVGAVWKMEFQERGAPHFHLFLWGIPLDECWSERFRANPANLMLASSYGDFRSWAEQNWYEVVGSGDLRHLRAGTNFQRIQKPGRLMNYVAGYVSKKDQTLPGVRVGRYWGVHNKEAVPTVEAEQTPMQDDDYKALRRMARRFQMANRMVKFHAARAQGRKMAKPKQRNNQSLSLVCDVDQWLARLPEIFACRRWWQEQQERRKNVYQPKKG